MTDQQFQSGLSKALRHAELDAPAPPDLAERLIRQLGASDVSAVERAPRRRAVLAAAAAAAVVVLAGSVAVVTLRPRGADRPTAPAPTSRITTSVASPRPDATPWTTTPIGSTGFRGRVTMLAAAGSLYVYGIDGLARLDRAGHVLARQKAVTTSDSLPASGVGAPVQAGAVLWAVTSSALVSLDPVTLSVRRSHPLPSRPAGTHPVLTSGDDGRTVFVASGSSIEVLNATTGAVSRTYRLGTDSVAAVAAAPDGRTLYAATETSNTGSGAQNVRLIAIDRISGTVTARTSITDFAGTEGLVAGPSLLWWSYAGSGIAQATQLVPTDLSTDQGPIPPGGFAGGGTVSQTTVIGSVAWTGGGPGALSCEDVGSGHTLGRLTATRASFVGVQAIGRTLYALHQDPSSNDWALVSFVPPAACRPH